jgi:hypothetical protein
VRAFQTLSGAALISIVFETSMAMIIYLPCAKNLIPNALCKYLLNDLTVKGMVFLR